MTLFSSGRDDNNPLGYTPPRVHPYTKTQNWTKIVKKSNLKNEAIVRINKIRAKN